MRTFVSLAIAVSSATCCSPAVRVKSMFSVQVDMRDPNVDVFDAGACSAGSETGCAAGHEVGVP